MGSQREALQALVDEGVITEDQRDRVAAALTAGEVQQVASKRRLLSEILSYVGGALVVISSMFVLAQAWDQLGGWGRSLLIGGASALLFVAGWLLGRSGEDDSSRRLASTLLTGSAALAAFAVGITLDGLLPPAYVDTPAGATLVEYREWRDPLVACAAGVAGFMVAAVGYRRSRSALGQLAMAGGAGLALATLGAIVSIVGWDSDDPQLLALLLVLALGAGWLVLTSRGAFRERIVGQFIGMAGLLIGVQGLRDSGLPEWLPAIATILLGGGLLAAYVRSRSWPLLVGGIAGLLVGGTELLVTYFEGALAALGTLVLGLLLLVAGLLLLRDRQPTSGQ